MSFHKKTLNLAVILALQTNMVFADEVKEQPVDQTLEEINVQANKEPIKD
jgi:hypothetical protein